MTIAISKIRGISLELAARLKEMGFHNSDQLLEATKTPAGRKALAGQMGVEPRDVLEWANRADLARVKGIGGIFSDLLEHAGVDTVKELATRRPDNLYAKLVETNVQAKLAGRLPTKRAAAEWVTQAGELPQILEY